MEKTMLERRERSSNPSRISVDQFSSHLKQNFSQSPHFAEKAKHLSTASSPASFLYRDTASPFPFTEISMNTSNTTENVSYSVPVFDDLSRAKVTVFFVMFGLCLIANIYTLYLILQVRRHRSVMNRLLVHLCVADLLVATFNMFGEALWVITVQWRAGAIECKLFKFAQPFSVTLSTYLVMFISIDRASVILCPMQRARHDKRVTRYIPAAYFFSFLINLPQFWVFTAQKAPFEHIVFIQCVHLHMLPGRISQFQNSLLFWWNWSMNYLVPLVLIITSYILILFKLHAASKETLGTVYEGLINSSTATSSGTTSRPVRCHFTLPASPSSSASGTAPPNSFSGSTSGGGVVLHTTVVDDEGRQRVTTYVCHNRNNLFRRAKLKSIQISAVIVAAFLLCWTPYYVTYLLKIVLNSQSLAKQLPKIFCFGQMSSLFNPLIYGIFHCNFGKRRKPVSYRVKWHRRHGLGKALSADNRGNQFTFRLHGSRRQNRRHNGYQMQTV